MNNEMHDIDNQLAFMLRGDFESGWQISEKLQAIGPENIANVDGTKNPELWLRHCFNRGWFLLQQGKYKEGCQHLESGRFLNVYGGGHLQTDAPLFNPDTDKIAGKSIIISLEGGYGDEIIHARFATSFKKLGAEKVYLAAAPELIGILSRIEGVDKVIQRDQAHTVSHDYWIPGFSAGWVAGHTYETMPSDPYLTPLSTSVDVWSNFIKADEPGKIKVGIRWAGNPKFEHQQFRRFPPDFMINLAKYEKLQVYSLQRDHNLQQLPENVIDLQHLLISWEDTLAAIANLDIVITSCTSIAHAAAALGKETWVFTPVLPYHTWTLNAPYSTTSPYYKCVKLYRQTNPTKWNDVFQRMYSDLEKKFDLEHIDLPNSDKVFKRINLGCGFLKLDGFENVDFSDICKPDKIVDLNKKKWDLPSDTYDHIVAKDILEHLDDLVNAIKEMYRISTHGAVWEISVPHHRCDHAFDDPTHKNVITAKTFKLFDMRSNIDLIQRKFSESYLGLQHKIDIEVCEVKYDFTADWLKRFETEKYKQQDIDFALNYYNNVAESTRILIQVFKPTRYDDKDINKMIESLNGPKES